MNDPSPVGSDFETAEEAEAYLRWLKAKVAESLADDRPPIDHDEAMRQIRAIIEAKRSLATDSKPRRVVRG